MAYSGYVPPKGNSGNYTAAEFQAAQQRAAARQQAARTAPQPAAPPQRPYDANLARILYARSGVADPVSAWRNNPYQGGLAPTMPSALRPGPQSSPSTAQPNPRQSHNVVGASHLPWQNSPTQALPLGYEWQYRDAGRSSGWRAVPSGPGAAQPVPGSSPGSPYGSPAQPYPAKRQPVAELPPDFEGPLPGPRPDPTPGGFAPSPATQDPMTQMWQQSMNAWAMPKQQLLQWGQQASQMPWGPNYANSPDGRPAPYSINVQGAFGNNVQDMWSNMGGFIQGVHNQAMQKPVGVYQGQGNPGAQYGKVNYDIRSLINQGNQMVQGGWQNPFMGQMPQWYG